MLTIASTCIIAEKIIAPYAFRHAEKASKAACRSQTRRRNQKGAYHSAKISRNHEKARLLRKYRVGALIMHIGKTEIASPRNGEIIEIT